MKLENFKLNIELSENQTYIAQFCHKDFKGLICESETLDQMYKDLAISFEVMMRQAGEESIHNVIL